MKIIIALYACLLWLPNYQAKESSVTAHFETISSPEQHIAIERKVALAEGKLLLWVLGGNWCHDSNSLAEKLAAPELKPIIDDYYRLSMVSVGYLNAGFKFTKVVDMTTFYATPTVIIIDPETMQQMNRQDMHLWANAYQIPLPEAVAYFKRYSQQKYRQLAELSSQQAKQMSELTQFIAHQEKRIRAAYQIVGPMLAEYKAGVKNTEFETSWQALAKLRMALPDIINKNRKLITSGQNSELDFNSDNLKPLPWEQDL